jgi:hypothetical protein
MKISDLAKEPELIQVSIDDPVIIEKYGEAIDFWTYDRQPLDVFLKLASAKQDDPATMIKALKPLLLNDKGEQVITGNKMIPTDILVLIISKLVSRLGN